MSIGVGEGPQTSEVFLACCIPQGELNGNAVDDCSPRGSSSAVGESSRRGRGRTQRTHLCYMVLEDCWFVDLCSARKVSSKPRI